MHEETLHIRSCTCERACARTRMNTHLQKNTSAFVRAHVHKTHESTCAWPPKQKYPHTHMCPYEYLRPHLYTQE